MAGSDRDEVLDKLHVVEFYASYGVELKQTGSSLIGKCPFHDDTKPSFSVQPEHGLFNCFSCGESGSPFDLVMRIEKVGFPEAFQKLAEVAGVELKHASVKKAEEPLLEEKADNPHSALLKNQERIDYLRQHRGISLESITKWKLGWAGERVVIPVRDKHGNLVNLRMHKPSCTKDEEKTISVSGHGKLRLFPALPPDGDPVLIVEGELDCIKANQEGFSAVSGTAGCFNWNVELSRRLSGRNVVVCYDNDENGIKGSAKVAAMLSSVAESVRVLQWPKGTPDKYDITDFFIHLGGTAESFRALVDEAKPYRVKEPKGPRPEATDVSLSKATAKENTGLHLRMRAVLAGKDTEPYTIPGSVTASCDQGYGKHCSTCRMADVKDSTMTMEFSRWDRAVLGMIRVRDEEQTIAMRKAFGVPLRCPRVSFDVTRWENIEELRVVPEVNGKLETTESGSHDSRTIYSFSHGLKPNVVYEMEGVTFPDVVDQHATILVGKSTPVESDIGSFKVTPEIRERLSVFQVPEGMTMRDKMDEIASELEKATHIAERRDAQHVLDLCWHSVIGFSAFGQESPKGWVEVMLMGDSAQAKSSIVKKLMDYYRCGYFVEGGNVSAAGLTAGAKKGHGDRWEISWGAMVLHDRKLIAIDEWDQMPEEQIGNLKSVRSSGMVEIQKISHGAAWARTRLVLVANPKGRLPLSHFPNGAEALVKLFSSPADIRRLDLVMGLKSGEVTNAVLDRVWEDESPRYTPEDCHDLILWAWSRKPGQVKFTKATQEAIVHVCQVLGEWHVDRIPLLEPADLRWKVARLAAAAAARVFSTRDGETLTVLPEHVSFVSSLMARCYEADALNFKRIGERDRAADNRVRDTWDEAVNNLSKLVAEPMRLADYLRYNDYIKPRDLEYTLGLDLPTTKSLTKTMAGFGWLEQARDGFRKRSIVNSMLRLDEDGGFEKWKDDMGIAQQISSVDTTALFDRSYEE